MYDYRYEPHRLIFMIDNKSFFASCEALRLGLNPMMVPLVVLSRLEAGKSAFDKRVEDFFAYYQDRGMLKWEGFFLSDHREQLAKARKTNVAPAFKPEMMSQEEAANALYLACFSEKQVKVVLSQVDSEGHFKTVMGRVSTDQEGGILIGQQKLDLDEIVQ